MQENECFLYISNMEKVKWNLSFIIIRYVISHAHILRIKNVLKMWINANI